MDLIYFLINSMKSKLKLLDKCEALTLLTTKASSRWSFIKFCFNIPLVFTSSAMCIINSISTDANEIKIPNIIVNAISVLIMSLANNTRASEKFEIFKKLSQQFMLLSQEIDAIEDDDIPLDEYKLLLLKYENLVQQIDFEEIPISYKNNVSIAYTNANRFVPIQLNGTIGNVVKKRPISDEIGFSRGVELNEMV